MNRVRKLLLVWFLPGDGDRVLPPWQQQQQQQVLQDVHALVVVDVALDMLQSLSLSGVQLRSSQHQAVVHWVGYTTGSPPQDDPNGVEVLVGAVVLVTDMVDMVLLLFNNKSLMMFLLLVFLRTMEQLLSDIVPVTSSLDQNSRCFQPLEIGFLFFRETLFCEDSMLC